MRDDVAEQHVDDERDDERDVVEAVRVRVDGLPITLRRRDAADPAEAGDVGHLAEEQVRDHRVGERDHQEVDPDAPARERAEEQPDADGDRRCPRATPHHGFQPRFRPFVLPFVVALPSDEAGDAEDRHLRERDHAAVGREEDQARRDDAEEQHLRQQRPDPVASRRSSGASHREHERADADDAVGRDARFTPASRTARAAARRARSRRART